MTRKQIEELCVEYNIKQLDVFVHASDTIAVSCFIKGGKLMRYDNRVVCRQNESLYAYIHWLGNGNANKRVFGTKEETPFMRDGKRVL